LLALIVGFGAARLQAQPSVADSTQADTAAVAAADSTTADPSFDWTRWPDIAAAIALQPLDGPEDILEKQEIIDDRIDDLTARGGALDTLAGAWTDRHRAMSTQLEVLDDLAEVQLGGDLEFQQRIESVREEVLQAAQQMTRIGSARRQLEAEVARLRALADDYRDQALRLREQEESDR
jgi:hypothetical protein